MNWFTNWKKRKGLKRDLKSLNSNIFNQQVLDEELKELEKTYRFTIAESQKMIKIIDTQRKIAALKEAQEQAHSKFLSSVKPTKEENEERCEHGYTEDQYCKICDEEEPLETDPEKIIARVIAEKMAQGMGGKSPSSPTVSATSGASPSKAKLQEMLNGMTDEQAQNFLANLGL